MTKGETGGNEVDDVDGACWTGEEEGVIGDEASLRGLSSAVEE